MGICSTVKIQDGDGFRVINESDFNEKEHKLFSEKKAPAPKAEPVKEAPAKPAAKKTTAKK